MGRLLMVAVLVAAVVVPSALAADPTPADFKNAAKYCKAVRESKGTEQFATLYGTNKNKKNAFGKCVSKTASANTGAQQSADHIMEVFGDIVAGRIEKNLGLVNLMSELRDLIDEATMLPA